MNYLLDTCVISELTKPRPKDSVISWIQQVEEEKLFISVLTLGEIEKGITKLSVSVRKTSLKEWIEKDLTKRFDKKILSITIPISRCWGILQGELELQGNPMPVIDGLIAATAIIHNLTLVTRNINDFEKSGVSILNIW